MTDISKGVPIVITECNMEFDTMSAETVGGTTQRVNTGQRMTLMCEVIGDNCDLRYLIKRYSGCAGEF